MAPNKNKGKGKGKKKAEDTSEVNPREAHCSQCKSFHLRPVGKKCTRPIAESTANSAVLSDDTDVTYNSMPLSGQPFDLLMNKLTNIERQQKEMSTRIS